MVGGKPRYLILFLILLGFIQSAAAGYDWYAPTDPVEYGGKINGMANGAEIYVECSDSKNDCFRFGNGEDEFDNGYRFDLCGETFRGEYSTDGSGNGFVGIQDGGIGGKSDISIPGEAPCGLGEHDVTLKTKKGDTLDSFDNLFSVGAKNMQPNKGMYIYAGWGDNTMKAFFLSNEAWFDCDGEGNPAGFDEYPDYDSPCKNGGRGIEKGAFILVKERDAGINTKDEDGVINARYGEIIKPENDLTVGYPEDPDGNGHVNTWKYSEPDSEDGCTEPDCWIAGNQPIELAKKFNKDFDQYSEGFWDAKLVGDPNFNPDSVSPLHRNGKYKPQGEIIAASPMSRHSKYSNPPPPGEYLNKREDVRFYVCRGDYKGSTRASSKKVKVMEEDSCSGGYCAINYHWEYYRCNTQNDWERIECPPGKEYGYRDSDGDGNSEYKCHPKKRPTINATFFDIKNVTETQAKRGYIAGFKLNASQYRAFEELYDKPMRKINAICWMGENDREPIYVNKAMLEVNAITQQDQGDNDYEDVWVLGRLDYRSNVNIATYSCTWGFKNKNNDPSIFEGTTPDSSDSSSNLLGSKDSGKIDIQYSRLQTIYQQVKSSNTDDPFPFGDYDTTPISYVPDGQEDPYDTPDQETPYCGSGVIGQIQCGGGSATSTSGLLSGLMSVFS